MTRTDEQRAAHAALMREWRRKNPEASRAHSRRRDEGVKADPERAARYRERRNEWMRQRRITHQDEIRRWNRESYLRNKFGLEPEDYQRLLAAQDGRCAICRTDRPGGAKKHFPVDHCHETGAVRGLLCDRCNRALGLFGDDVEILLKAAEYLRC